MDNESSESKEGSENGDVNVIDLLSAWSGTLNEVGFLLWLSVLHWVTKYQVCFAEFSWAAQAPMYTGVFE